MKREELEIDDGLICLSINGKSETVFNPTDFGFIERLFHVIDVLDSKQAALEARIKSSQPKDIFKIARECDSEMREMLDGVMGAGTSAAQFGDMNVYAYAEGFPVWANLLLAVLDRCETEMVTQQQLTHPRLEKYTAKYKKAPVVGT